MNIISNGFAIGFLLLIALSFFRGKYFMTKASHYYASALALSFLTSITNIAFIFIRRDLSPRNWMLTLFATVEYLLPVLVACMLCLYFITKIVEHIHNHKLLTNAKIITTLSYCIFFLITAINVCTDIIFYIDENGKRVIGPLWFIDYLFILIYLLTIAYYSIKYHKHLSRNVANSIIHSLVIILFCALLKIFYEEMDLLITAIILVEGVFYINLQNQRIGVHSLTKLNDRRRFIIELENRMRKGTPFKIFAIKIENFDLINQIHGHKSGDELLYLFAFSLDKLFSGASTFHMHGTSFAIIVPMDNEDANADALSEFLAKPVKYGNYSISLDTLLVEAEWTDEVIGAPEFYERIEYTIARASENKMDYLHYTPELNEDRIRKKYVISRLAQVDREHGFEVWFQPMYNLKKEGFYGMEALIRLHEPDGSMISPGEFIPIAEKTGLIVSITRFVINEVCRAIVANDAFDGVRVSINLPLFHLLDPTFPSKLNEIVDGHGIDHSRIAFEFTERTIFEDLDTAEKIMKKLASDGYSFYLDDFGVGYSNFNCVMKLPISVVKLDKDLTYTVEGLEGNYNLVNILTDLFHDMGIVVTAEGAETERQIELLKQYNIDYVQGYYYARPMPIAGAVEFFKKQKGK